MFQKLKNVMPSKNLIEDVIEEEEIQLELDHLRKRSKIN
jgi:hypothetical protein